MNIIYSSFSRTLKFKYLVMIRVNSIPNNKTMDVISFGKNNMVINRNTYRNTMANGTNKI